MNSYPEAPVTSAPKYARFSRRFRGIVLDWMILMAILFGALEEALKWGQPSYLTTESKSGSTIRIDQVKAAAGQYAVYFHCQTDLVETFRERYPELRYGGNRSILLDASDKLPEAALRHCVALALTYHLRKRKAARAA